MISIFPYEGAGDGWQRTFSILTTEMHVISLMIQNCAQTNDDDNYFCSLLPLVVAHIGGA